MPTACVSAPRRRDSASLIYWRHRMHQQDTSQNAKRDDDAKRPDDSGSLCVLRRVPVHQRHVLHQCNASPHAKRDGDAKRRNGDKPVLFYNHGETPGCNFHGAPDRNSVGVGCARFCFPHSCTSWHRSIGVPKMHHNTLHGLGSRKRAGARNGRPAWWCVIAVLMASFNTSSGHGGETNRRGLAHFSLAELQESSPDQRTRLQRALQEQGAIVVTGVPGLEGTAADALDDFGDCLGQRPEVAGGQSTGAATRIDKPLRRLLLGGVERSTLATFTKAGTSEPLPSWTGAKCPRFKESSAKLRAFVDWLVGLFARSVDAAAGIAIVANQRKFSKSAIESQLLQNVVKRGTHVEHFHRYLSPSAADEGSQAAILANHDDKHALQMHTDMGLFQALAIRWRATGDRGGLNLKVELPDGSTVSVEPLSAASEARGEGNGLLFLVGQGAADWMPHLRLRPAPHALALHARVRAERFVYGVMVLPPDDWPLPTASNVTFGEWWRRSLSAMASASSDESSSESPKGSSSSVADIAVNTTASQPLAPANLGCLSAPALRRRLTDLAGSCPAGSLYCWMQCVDTGNLPCHSHLATCTSQSGQLCTNDVHDASCAPRCPPPPGKLASGPTGNGFCNGIMTDMHMTGFVWAGEEHPCLIFLFPGWELTDGARFWLTAVGTVLAGVLAEYLVYVRRWQDQSHAGKRSAGNSRFMAVAKRAWCLTLYSSSRTLGYFVMLVTMTYSVELFTAVLVGLTIGFALFNMDAPAGDGLTPCCQNEAPGQRLVTGQPLSESAPSALGRLRFVVTGMTCGACLTTVRRAVEGVSVVQAVTESSLASGVLEVELKSAIGAQDRFASAELVYKAVDDVGFTVEEVVLRTSSQQAAFDSGIIKGGAPSPTHPTHKQKMNLALGDSGATRTEQQAAVSRTPNQAESQPV